MPIPSLRALPVSPPALAPRAFPSVTNGPGDVFHASTHHPEPRLIDPSSLAQLKGQDDVVGFLEKFPELDLYVSADVEISPEAQKEGDPTQPPSMKIWGERFVEFDKAVSSLRCRRLLQAGDYDGFVSAQRRAVAGGRLKAEEVLSLETFDALKGRIDSVLSNPAWEHAMDSFLVLGNAGKSQKIRDLVKARGLEASSDEQVLAEVLRTPGCPFRSYVELEPDQHRRVLNCTGTCFNANQMAQLEGIPAHLISLSELSPAERNFLLVKDMLHLAAAAGSFNPDGSVVMTESTARNYLDMMASVDGLEAGRTPTEVYAAYLTRKAERLDLPVGTVEEKTLARLNGMLRSNTAEDVAAVAGAYARLGTEARERLGQLGRFEEDGPQPWVYFGPALLLNAQKNGELEQGLETFAELLGQGRELLDRLPLSAPNVLTVNGEQVAKTAKGKGALASARWNYQLQPDGVLMVTPAATPESEWNIT